MKIMFDAQRTLYYVFITLIKQKEIMIITTIGLPLKNTKQDEKLLRQINWLMKRRKHRTRTGLLRCIIEEAFDIDKLTSK